MPDTITIDSAGRLVIPKAVRDRYRLAAGATLNLSEEDGRIVLTPATNEPQVVEVSGFLILRLSDVPQLSSDHRALREARTEEQVRDALRP